MPPRCSPPAHRRGWRSRSTPAPSGSGPPLALLRRAVAEGCLFAIDTDAHAPGQLDWQLIGCDRAMACGVPASSIVNTWPVEDLLAWADDHTHRPA